MLHLFRLLESFEVDESVKPLGSVQRKVEPEEEELNDVEDESIAGSVAGSMQVDAPTDTEAAAVSGQGCVS